ncbi:hypothetical protein CPB83DRAFT_769027 [Crepidotus variabilis]|uniref:Sodium/calcium exchanger membrane region domain-containing protein n=1 Tax=Crepidotus variabilis TaxID=179855 RepID=A0A9P6JNI8_9AGAR|nr:hypothetical protein CPB83DRAFT_769027 [Crepidotus variabilis]
MHDLSRTLDPAVTSLGVKSHPSRQSHFSDIVCLDETKAVWLGFRDRFNRKGKRKIGVGESLRNLALSSWLNILLILIPLAWVAQEGYRWGHQTVFLLGLFGIIPLARLFDYGGEQMLYYLGKDLGGLVSITLNNAVEAALGIILLLKCQLVLLKSTIVGVVILHLFVPGTAFIVGGARIIQQDLHPHVSQLNRSMLMVGVLGLLLPTVFFAALNTSFGTTGRTSAAVTDVVRGKMLQLSYGLAVLLLIVYLCSRLYLHNPPGNDTAFELHLTPNAPEALQHEADKLEHEDPEVNQWVCLVMLAVCMALLAITAEWIGNSLDVVLEESNISEIWLGLVLFPLVSFAGDGAVATVYFVRHFFSEPVPPSTLAQAEAIDLSIQFVLFWMPFFVLVGWFCGRPMTLLFDLFEVVVLVGSCFLVNYVTADAKTNWAEGAAMVISYFMIALVAWFYGGQPDARVMSTCGSVASALAARF